MRSLAPLLGGTYVAAPSIPAPPPRPIDPVPTAEGATGWHAGVTPLASPLRVPRTPAPGPARPAAVPRAKPPVVTFVIDRTAAQITGYRANLGARALAQLAAPSFHPQATLDLHGLRARQLEPYLAQALRDLLHDGPTRILLIHGKGLHSPRQTGVLRDAVVTTLTEGGCARHVRAFRTAPARLGGEGALLVEIARG